MDILQHMQLGLSVAMTSENLFYCFVGCLVGTMIGVLPGIGPLATLSMLLPGQGQICGPEARAARAKSIGGIRIPSGDPRVLPQEEAGPSGARGHPYNG